ncbi:transposase [Mycobacterium sp. ITM-2016-00318]
MPAVTCPRCGSTDTYRIDKSRQATASRWECGNCEKLFILPTPPGIAR